MSITDVYDELPSFDRGLEKRIKKFEPSEEGYKPYILRASEMQRVCPREVFFRTIEYRKRPFDRRSYLKVAFGTFLHAFLQNEVLGPMGILKGDWRCSECGKVLYSRTKPEPHEHGGRFLFSESEHYDKRLRVKFHPDGILTLDDNWLLEIKTTSDYLFKNDEIPAYYLMQVNIYLRNLDVERCKFLIVSRNIESGLKVKIFDYRYDESWYEAARRKADIIWAALDESKPPSCACVDMDSKEAKTCPYFTECCRLNTGEALDEIFFKGD